MAIHLPVDAAQVELFRSSRLTRYGYEEIITAAAEVQQAEADFAALLCGPINTLLRPYEAAPDGRSYIRRDYPSDLEPLANLFWEAQQRVSIPANGRADVWPVRQWQQQTRTYRAWIKRLEQEVARAQQTLCGKVTYLLAHLEQQKDALPRSQERDAFCIGASGRLDRIRREHLVPSSLEGELRAYLDDLIGVSSLFDPANFAQDVVDTCLWLITELKEALGEGQGSAQQAERSPLLNKTTDAFYALIQQAQAESGWTVVIEHEKWYLETANGRKLMGTVKRTTVDRLAKAGWLAPKKNEATGSYDLYIR